MELMSRREKKKHNEDVDRNDLIDDERAMEASMTSGRGEKEEWEEREEEEEEDEDEEGAGGARARRGEEDHDDVVGEDGEA